MAAQGWQLQGMAGGGTLLSLGKGMLNKGMSTAVLGPLGLFASSRVEQPVTITWTRTPEAAAAALRLKQEAAAAAVKRSVDAAARRAEIKRQREETKAQRQAAKNEKALADKAAKAEKERVRSEAKQEKAVARGGRQASGG